MGKLDRCILMMASVMILSLGGCNSADNDSRESPTSEALEDSATLETTKGPFVIDGLGTLSEVNLIEELPEHWRTESDDIPGMITGALVSSEFDIEIIYGVGDEMVMIMRSGPPGMVEFHQVELYGQQFECGLIFEESLTLIFEDEGPASFSADVTSEEEANYVVELIARYRNDLLGVDLKKRANKEASELDKLEAIGKEVLVERNNLSELPSHWSNGTELGIDTLVGRFSSSEKDFVIRYDIGMGAGNFAQSRRKASKWFTETEMYGERFFCTWGIDNQLYITFEDEGPSNFMTTVDNQDDVDYVVELVAKYRNELLDVDLKEQGRKQAEWMKQMQAEYERDIAGEVSEAR